MTSGPQLLLCAVSLRYAPEASIAQESDRAFAGPNQRKGESIMADVRVENQRAEQGRELEQRRGGTLAQRGEREGWMNPFSLMRRLSQEMDRAFATSFGLPTSGRTGVDEDLGVWLPP